MHLQEATYHKLLKGDPINDWELDSALKFWKNLETELSKIGPRFAIAHMEAVHVYTKLLGFKQTREVNSLL